MDRVTEGARRGGWEAAPSGQYPAGAHGEGAEFADEGSAVGTDYADGAAGPAERRRSTEPLRASWRPIEPDTRRRKPTGVRRFTAAFGWRAYLVPLLLVVTALVVFDTTRTSGSSGGPDDGGSSAAGEEREPLATEVPVPRDIDIPTAELPEGGEYSQAGKGTWHVLPVPEGKGEQVGDSPDLFTYTVEVEDGIDPASYQGDDSFGVMVTATLSNPRSWTGNGDVSFRRVDDSDPNPDFRVSLSSPDTTAEHCGRSIDYESSCYLSTAPGGPRVIINLARWVRGAVAFESDMAGYRQYVVNHEVGHALGLGHEGCPDDGALAPVMMQQSFGIENDYVARLNSEVGGGDPVEADGKVCKPNAWPNPAASKPGKN